MARSMLVLRALTHRNTGGIIAAATTSLPEDFGGVRNWDYRYCWLRDAALSLETLLTHGHVDAAVGWRERSEEHTSELQSRGHLVCRLLLEKKKPRLQHDVPGDVPMAAT